LHTGQSKLPPVPGTDENKIIPLEIDSLLNTIHKFRSYLTGITLSFCYRKQPVNDVWKGEVVYWENDTIKNHVDRTRNFSNVTLHPLSGNDRRIITYTISVAKEALCNQRPLIISAQARHATIGILGNAFSSQSLPRCYKPDELVNTGGN
jgi:hypothetical protein